MDAIGVKTFVDQFGFDHEIGERIIGCEDMG
jgi:hypothetical protein